MFLIFTIYTYIVFQKMSKDLIVKRMRLNSEELIVIYFEDLIVKRMRLNFEDLRPVYQTLTRLSTYQQNSTLSVAYRVRF